MTDYLRLLIETPLSLHLSYTDFQRGIYVFQNSWLEKASEIHGFEKCEQEIKSNIKKMIERTLEQYKKYNREMPIGDTQFLKEIEAIKDLRKNSGRISIFCIGKEKKLEVKIESF